MTNTERRLRVAVGGLVLAASAAACSSSVNEAPPPPPSATASPSNGVEFPPGTIPCNPNLITKADQTDPVIFTCPDGVKVDTNPGFSGAGITVFNGRKSVSEGVVGWNAGMPVSFPVPGSQGERVFVSTAGGGIAVSLSGGRSKN